MELTKDVETKYGIVKAIFHFEENVWVAHTIEDSDIPVVIQEDTFDKAWDRFIEFYEDMYEYNEECENNPYKGVVDMSSMRELFDYNKFWLLSRN